MHTKPSVSVTHSNFHRIFGIYLGYKDICILKAVETQAVVHHRHQHPDDTKEISGKFARKFNSHFCVRK